MHSEAALAAYATASRCQQVRWAYLAATRWRGGGGARAASAAAGGG
eukprot:COSAG01_NODE_6786_length_3498_cov_15.175051_1_plen_45_part_10